jgi:PEP-CTERM motif
MACKSLKGQMFDNLARILPVTVQPFAEGKKMKTRISALVLAAFLGGPLAAQAGGVITLNFEGIGPYPNTDNIAIENYYNGGAASDGTIGPNYGVTFSASARLLCLNTLTVVCSNTSKGRNGGVGSELGALSFSVPEPTSLLIDVPRGFTTGFAMDYSNPYFTQSVAIYSGLDGSGTLLASGPLSRTPYGLYVCPGYNAEYCPFEDFSLAFSGTAMSVEFIGEPSAYDDLTFGSTTVAVPEPRTLALFGLGLGMAALGLRRRRQSIPA